MSGNDPKTFYITTPIYYPSGRLTVGHAYTTVAADTAARLKRMQGYDVMFLTGTDEHGQKIEKRAKAAGLEPMAFLDGAITDIKALWKMMNITYDQFIRTTDGYHEKAVQKIYERLYEQGDIYKHEYEGLYCVDCESFWTDTQAVGGNCPDCGRPVEMTREESYFLRLSKYADRLVKHYEEHPEFLQPQSRVNEMLNNFIKPGLKDLCVSRTSFKWGIPLPFDEKHIAYVWVDALSNYITALGYASDDESRMERYWPADLHLVGKEIVRFHAIIWPIILMALDLPLPKTVFGHGWLLLDGGKLSKSKSAGANVVDPVILCERYGVDAIRYFLMREMPFGGDGQFSNEALIHRVNADLANDLGNLVSRTCAMSDRYFEGNLNLPPCPEPIDGEIKTFAADVYKNYIELMDNLQFPTALAEVWKLISRANKYIDETTPWILAKDEANKPRLCTVLKTLCEAVRVASILIKPVMPATADKIFELTGTVSASSWDDTTFDNTRSFTTSTGAPLFPRIDVEKEMEELLALTVTPASETADKPQDKPQPETKTETAKPEKPTDASASVETSPITIDDFAKVQLRVALVLECEEVPQSDKLLKLQVDLGPLGRRQIVSGIRQWYSPADLVNKKVIVVANLAPAKLRGELSEGMLLAADAPSGVSVVFAPADTEPGSVVR